MKYVAVLPYAYRPFLDECAATMHPDFKERVLFVDNTNPATNLGIMRSHNMGVAKMFEEGADWLIIISAAIRFGKAGGLDFVKVLEDNPEHYIIHAGTPNSTLSPNIKEAVDEPRQAYRNGVFGWHLTAFKREVFENIGTWDENFSPYSLDDVDLSIRVQKHYKGAPGWGTFPVDVSDTVMAHGINLGGVKGTYPPRASYFERKWGRAGGEWQKEAWDHPFNNPANALSYWPSPEEPTSIFQNEYKTGGWKYDG